MFSFIIVIVAEMTLVSTKPSKCYIRYCIFHLIPHTPAMDSSRLFNDDPMSLLTSAFTNQHTLFTKTFCMVVHSIRSHITHTSQLLCRYVWVLQNQVQNLFRSLFRSHHILRLPNGRIYHKLILPVLRCRQSSLRHLTEHPIHALAKLLHQLVRPHIQRNLRVPRKVHLPNVIRSHQAGQNAGSPP